MPRAVVPTDNTYTVMQLYVDTIFTRVLAITISASKL